MTRIEICVDDVAGVSAASRAGADRVELCARLDLGGITPSATLVEEALPVAPAGGLRVIIRPRGGDFVHTDAEVDQMVASIEDFVQLWVRLRRRKAAGGVTSASAADQASGALLGGVPLATGGGVPLAVEPRSLPPLGFVVGVLRPDGRIHEAAAKRLREAAREYPLTFHRAFDVVPDRAQALETLIRLGYTHVLTTGGHPSVAQVDELAALTRQARERIAIIASGGIRQGNVIDVIAASGAPEVHMRCPLPRAGAGGVSEGTTGGGTDAKQVRQIVTLVRTWDACRQ
ncbi:copper homeostasis protein CutC [Schaalia suimastitidis]|uniref:copper homeostasis protein CutC n=1 Tax=Schaalia suimastitidis TaxID=121163 RepID=UPI0003FA5EBE|nr:copper homeostasis protein CutC [Schaalia suimastitidis]